MPTRRVIDAARARGSLAVDPKSDEGLGAPFAERALAWDEDGTTLAIDAARALPRAERAVLGQGIDAETFRVALDLPQSPVVASDPMLVAMSMTGRVWAIGCPPESASAVAALVDDADGAPPAAPRDVSAPPRMVSTLRALHESRRVPPTERFPDSPMGAYVPMGTWVEDLPARLRLVAQRCDACGRTLYPPRGACPACRSHAFTPTPLPDEAEVYAVTRIGKGGAPSEFALEQAMVGAYRVAVLAWPAQGVRVTARLAGGETEPRIGQRARPVVRRLFEQEGLTRYGVKFSLVP